MKGYKKILIVLLVILLLTNSVFISPKKTHAFVFPLAIPPAIAAGEVIVGLVAGGIALAGLGSKPIEPIEIEQKVALERTIITARESALAKWKVAPANVQQDWELSYNDAIARGADTVTMPESMSNYIETAIVPSLYGTLETIKAGESFITKYHERVGMTDIYLTDSFIYNGYVYNGYQHRSSIYYRMYSYNYVNGSWVRDASIPHITATRSMVDVDGVSYHALTMLDATIEVPIPNPTVDKYADQVGKQVEQVLNRAKNSGIKLPAVLGALGSIGLLYDPSTNLLYDDAGNVFDGSSQMIDWAGYKPGDVSIGVREDGTVITGEGDIPVVLNPGYSIPGVGDIPATDVITGNPVNTANPPIEGEVPPGTINPPKEKWNVRMMNAVTTKFPFSLPWDFAALLGLLVEEPVTPHIKIDQEFMDMDFKFEVTLDKLDPYIGFFRTFIVIGFCISLILATRNLLGGSV